MKDTEKYPLIFSPAKVFVLEVPYGHSVILPISVDTSMIKFVKYEPHYNGQSEITEVNLPVRLEVIDMPST